MSGPCMIAATKDLGFVEIGTGHPTKGGRSAMISHPDLGMGAVGVGPTLKAARRHAAEIAYGRYWESRLASDAAIASAFGPPPAPGEVKP